MKHGYGYCASEKIKNLLVFILILLSVRTSIIGTSDVFLVIVFVFSFILFFRCKNKIKKAFVILSLYYFLHFILIWLIFGKINLNPYLGLYFRILLSLFMVGIIGRRFFLHYYNVMYFVAFVSLPLFLLQILIPNIFFKVNSFIAKLLPFYNTRGDHFSNSIIFTFNLTHPYRNCGIGWEPSVFGALLLIAIFIGLVYNNLNFKDKKIIIMLIALATTLSTTGYVLFTLILFFYIYNQKKKNLFIYIPIFLTLIILFFQLDFIADKIEAQYQSMYDFKNRKTWTIGLWGESRFTSMILDLYDFSVLPITGHGFEREKRYDNTYFEFKRTNSMTRYLAMFGLLGYMVLLYNLIRSNKKFMKYKKYKGKILFPLLILLTTFSAPILMTPLYYGFQMYGYIDDKEGNYLNFTNKG